MIALTYEPIDVPALKAALLRPEDGAIVVFEGVVRNHSRGRRVVSLEYQAYDAMALRKLQELALLARERYALRDIGIVQRLGRLSPGESSVAIAAFAEHRSEAFEACRFAIDTLKNVVPVWKKEFYDNGEVWIEGGD